MPGVDGVRPYVWVPNSKIKDGKAYVLRSEAKFDDETQNYIDKNEEGNWI